MIVILLQRKITNYSILQYNIQYGPRHLHIMNKYLNIWKRFEGVFQCQFCGLMNRISIKYLRTNENSLQKIELSCIETNDAKKLYFVQIIV